MLNSRHQSVAQIRALGVGFVAVIRRWVLANRLQDRVWWLQLQAGVNLFI